MRLLFVADLHYSLKQFDWLKAHACNYDAVLIGGDLLDLSSALDADVQITIVEKYLRFVRERGPVAVSSGNHDGDSRNAADESVAGWIQGLRAEGIYVDGDSFDFGNTRFTVCPWWDGDLTRGELQVQIEREAARSKSRWIWIHHAPPEGAKTCWTGRKFVGDEYLRGWIEWFPPDMSQPMPQHAEKGRSFPFSAERQPRRRRSAHGARFGLTSGRGFPPRPAFPGAPVIPASRGGRPRSG